MIPPFFITIPICFESLHHSKTGAGIDGMDLGAVRVEFSADI